VILYALLAVGIVVEHDIAVSAIASAAIVLIFIFVF
jgi:hypothetical protein